MKEEKQPSVKIDWAKLIPLLIGLIIGGILILKFL